MKRSQLVNKIINMIETDYRDVNLEANLESIADDILNVIEDAGMIPPLTLVNIGHGEYLTSYWEDDCND